MFISYLYCLSYSENIIIIIFELFYKQFAATSEKKLGQWFFDSPTWRKNPFLLKNVEKC